MKRRNVQIHAVASMCDAIGAGSASVTHYSEKTQYNFILSFRQLEKLKCQVDAAYATAQERFFNSQAHQKTRPGS
jgi:hypothetical protein